MIAIKFFLPISLVRANNLLISIQGTDEQFCRMGSLAWLGYLSHTQVVESSNLSPSTFQGSILDRSKAAGNDRGEFGCDPARQDLLFLHISAYVLARG